MKPLHQTPKYCCSKGGCPFANTDESKQIQSMKCLPTKEQIVELAKSGKTWTCHSDRRKPCLGLLKEYPHKVKELVYLYEGN